MSNSNYGYIIIGNKPYELQKIVDKVMFQYANMMVWYDEMRDGPVVTQAQLRERYPEWLL